MKNSGAISEYQQSSVRGATPVGLIIALYDTILRDFRRALDALDSSNVEARVFELNHALTVIAHLKNVLDHDKGGDAASQFSRFYEVTRAMIVDVNLKSSRESLLQLTELYTGLRQAWLQADRNLSVRSAGPSVAPASAPSKIANPPSPAPASEDLVPEARGRWSA
jgi:flagellar protein FliS